MRFVLITAATVLMLLGAVGATTKNVDIPADADSSASFVAQYPPHYSNADSSGLQSLSLIVSSISGTILALQQMSKKNECKFHK